MTNYACPYCERDFCDTDCAFADRHGRIDIHGNDGPRHLRKTAKQIRDEVTEQIAAWLEGLLHESEAYSQDWSPAEADLLEAIVADVRDGCWRTS